MRTIALCILTTLLYLCPAYGKTIKLQAGNDFTIQIPEDWQELPREILDIQEGAILESGVCP